MADLDGEILLCTNKKAYFNYFLSEFTECGIELKGSEIKALRAGHCSLDYSYVIIKGGEVYLLNRNIPILQSNNSLFSHEPTRTRKLLLHKKQILAFRQNVEREGYTLVPVRVYIKKGICKVQIALAKGKKNYDKREVIKEREDKIHASRRRKAINQR